MNHVYHRKYVLEIDVWDPMRKFVDEEVDHVIFALKNRKLIGHAGNVKITLAEEERL